MLTFLLLSLLSVSFYILLKKILRKNFLKVKGDYEAVRKEYDILLAESTSLKEENSDLRNILDGTTALYDITKDICKSLDIDTVFDNFRSRINKYIALDDCKFIKGDLDSLLYADYTILPLKINRGIVGYLVAHGIRPQDQDKYHILAQQFILGIKRAILYQRVQELAITDGLTGVFTRRHYLGRLEEELSYAKKFNQHFSFLMIDIDHFKRYNDTYGHLVGDAILREISRVIKDNLRQIDLIGRYGGEEFSIILTQTDKGGAKFVAERIRQAVENKLIKVYDEDLKATVSIGVAVFPDDAKEMQDLIEKSDEALYKAKESGRNRICFWNEKNI